MLIFQPPTSSTNWWTRPLVRFVAALLLPLLVPAVITGVLWILPGDPAEIICPPQICQGTAALAARWGLDQGPWTFSARWLGTAVRASSATPGGCSRDRRSPSC